MTDASTPQENLTAALDANTEKTSDQTVAMEENTAALGSSPLEKTDELTQALKDNTNALKRVKNRYRSVLIFVAALVGLTIFTVESDHDNRVTSCRLGNDFRTEVNGKFDNIGVLLLGGREVSDLDAEELNVFNVVTARFTLRDCERLPWF